MSIKQPSLSAVRSTSPPMQPHEVSKLLMKMATTHSWREFSLKYLQLALRGASDEDDSAPPALAQAQQRQESTTVMMCVEAVLSGVPLVPHFEVDVRWTVDELHQHLARAAHVAATTIRVFVGQGGRELDDPFKAVSEYGIVPDDFGSGGGGDGGAEPLPSTSSAGSKEEDHPEAYKPIPRVLAVGQSQFSADWADAIQKGRARFDGAHNGGVNFMNLSADGVHLVTAGADSTAALWNIRTGRRLRLLSGHTSEVSCVASSPDGRCIYTSSYDGRIIVWDLRTGSQLLTHYIGPTVRCIVPTWDSTSLFYGDDSKGAAIVDVRVVHDKDGASGVVETQKFRSNAAIPSRVVRWPPRVFRRPVTSAVMLADGHRMALTSYKEVQLWDFAAPADANPDEEIVAVHLHTFVGHTSTVSCVAASRDGKLLASGDGAHRCIIWNVENRTCRRVLRCSSMLVWQVTFAPNDRAVYVGQGNGMVCRYPIKGMKTAKTVLDRSYGHFGANVNGVALTVDGRFLVVASGDGSVYIRGLKQQHKKRFP